MEWHISVIKITNILSIFFNWISETDISRPLKNSFIHTGHGDVGGKSWGSPIVIDE
jgi:hypothetical protein